MFKLIAASRIAYVLPAAVTLSVPTYLVDSKKETNLPSNVYFPKVTQDTLSSKFDTKLQTYHRKINEFGLDKYIATSKLGLVSQNQQMSSEDFFKNGGKSQSSSTVTTKPTLNYKSKESNSQGLKSSPQKFMEDGVNITFDKEFPKGTHKYIVFGATGCGKSTFINQITSYFGDGTLQAPRVAIPNEYYKSTEMYKHTERNMKDRSQAQTDGVTDYIFKVGDSTIIVSDTPGLNDTKGVEQDDKNLSKIIDSAIASESISGIVLVVNGTNARVTNEIRVLINKFKGFLPDSIMQNVIVVFTMCRPETCNFTDLKQLGIEPAKVFYMNNTAFSSNPTTWTDTTMLQLEWNQSMVTTNELFAFATSMTSVATFEFEQMRTIRNHIKHSLHDARTKIMSLAKIQNEYLVAKADAEKYQATEEQFKNYTVQKQVEKTELVPHGQHSTVCSRCTVVCHQDCGLNEITEKDADKTGISRCSCFYGTSCSRCGCDPTTHYHARVREETRMVTLDEEVEDLKKKYLVANKSKADALKQMSDHDLFKASIEKEIEDLKAAIIKDCNELKSICKNYNLVGELTDLISQLETESNLLTSVDARQTCQQFVDSLKKLVDSLMMDPNLAKLSLNSNKNKESTKKSSWFGW